MAVVGGYGVTGLSFRELTPQTCRALYAAADASSSYLAAPGSGPVRPASPRDLCLRLQPAFEAWRRAAPPAPLDLADLDRRQVSISGRIPEPSGSRAAAPEVLFY